LLTFAYLEGFVGVDEARAGVGRTEHWVGRRSLLGEIVVAVSGWAVAIGAVATVHLDSRPVHEAALFAHLVFLVMGFGGVIAVDVHGLLWVLGRRTTGELVAMSTATHGLIAAGVAGLLASGAVLHPDLASSAARLKLTLVLIIVLNGVNARRFATELRAIPHQVGGDAIPWEYLPRAFTIAALSQAAWWGALVIGFLTSASGQ
jgi:hypothetical protein